MHPNLAASCTEVPLVTENQDRISYAAILSLPRVAASPRDESNSYSAAR
jgi:hypothetical protein